LQSLKIIVLGTRGFPGIQGGIEKHCEELFPRLVKLSCQVTVITRKPYVDRSVMHSLWQGVEFIPIWAPKRKNIETIFHTFLGIVLARLKSPDILHIHGIGPSIFVPFARIINLKVVMTDHGPDYNRQKWGPLGKAILRVGELFGVKFAHKVIAVSKLISDIIKDKHCRNDVVFIPNGVTLPLIIPPGDSLKKFGLAPRQYIFTACRFVPEKGLHDLVSAFSRIENPQFKLVIAGDADHESNYSRRIKESARRIDGIILTGSISGLQLQELYSNAGLFVLPSYYEGLPIALLEALSYGLPVLVSDIPANREIILPEVRYFHLGDIDELSKKMVLLFENGISETETNQQKQMLLNNYNWDKIAQETLEVYKDCLKSSKR